MVGVPKWCPVPVSLLSWMSSISKSFISPLLFCSCDLSFLGAFWNLTGVDNFFRKTSRNIYMTPVSSFIICDLGRVLSIVNSNFSLLPNFSIHRFLSDLCFLKACSNIHRCSNIHWIHRCPVWWSIPRTVKNSVFFSLRLTSYGICFGWVKSLILFNRTKKSGCFWLCGLIRPSVLYRDVMWNKLFLVRCLWWIRFFPMLSLHFRCDRFSLLN